MTNANESGFPVIIYGTIDKTGAVKSGSGFVCQRQSEGNYVVIFSQAFTDTPAVVGNQTGYGSIGESTLDQVVFPLVTNVSFTALTGLPSGSASDRGFSFIAAGSLSRQSQ